MRKGKWGGEETRQRGKEWNNEKEKGDNGKIGKGRK